MILIDESFSCSFITQLTKYIVASKQDLIRDLNNWTEFFLAGRLQKPVLLADLGGAQGAKRIQEFNLLSSLVDSPTQSPLSLGVKENLLNAVS